MSKKINSALKVLKKALEAHADAVGGSAVSLKKAQRTSAKVAAAAGAYAEAVYAKSGVSTPFSDMPTPGLEPSTVASLTAERDSIKEQLTGPVPIQQPAQTDHHEPESAGNHTDFHASAPDLELELEAEPAAEPAAAADADADTDADADSDSDSDSDADSDTHIDTDADADADAEHLASANSDELTSERTEA